MDAVFIYLKSKMLLKALQSRGECSFSHGIKLRTCSAVWRCGQIFTIIGSCRKLAFSIRARNRIDFCRGRFGMVTRCPMRMRLPGFDIHFCSNRLKYYRSTWKWEKKIAFIQTDWEDIFFCFAYSFRSFNFFCSSISIHLLKYHLSAAWIEMQLHRNIFPPYDFPFSVQFSLVFFLIMGRGKKCRSISSFLLSGKLKFLYHNSGFQIDSPFQSSRPCPRLSSTRGFKSPTKPIVISFTSIIGFINSTSKHSIWTKKIIWEIMRARHKTAATTEMNEWKSGKKTANKRNK